MSIYNRSASCLSESRLLSISEVMHEKFNLHKDHPFGVYFHSLTLLSNEEISHIRVQIAFYKLSKLHKLLRCCLIKDSNGDLLFHEMNYKYDDWMLFTMHDVTTEVDWLTITTSLLSVRFDAEKGPMWRVIWMKFPNKNDIQYKYVLVFVAMHLICDARSVFDLLTNQFMPLLENNSVESNYVQNKPISFPKSFEMLFENKTDAELSVSRCNTPLIMKWVINTAHWLYHSSLSTAKFDRFKQVDKRRNSSSLSHFLLHINPDLSKEFIDICKLHKCSVHAVLITVLTIAGIDLAKDSGLPVDTLKTINFPIDMRKFNKELTTSPMPLGQFVGMGKATPKISLPYDKESLFCQAQIITADIKKQNISQQSSIFAMAIAHILKKKWDLSHLARYIFSYPLLYFSNIGSCNSYKSNGQIQVEAQNFGVNTKDSIFVTLMTFNNSMRFCVGYDNGWFNSEYVEKFVTKIYILIEELTTNT
ncbi:uncharacterized protein LOC105847626 isoform X2 [Hydra vulgaris]|uniref:Uncharacterized protein LOC105847626 isoform X2 n=1 Tax=Hydra vulgaris TaxID=6087 RepID=A0ABM4D6W3_HYDVU